MKKMSISEQTPPAILPIVLTEHTTKTWRLCFWRTGNLSSRQRESLRRTRFGRGFGQYRFAEWRSKGLASWSAKCRQDSPSSWQL